MDHHQLIMNNNSLSSVLTLSQGALNKIKNGEQFLRPSLQVLDIIHIDELCYHLVVSDGETMTLAILPAKLKSIIENNQLTKFSIIEITSYTMQHSCLVRGKLGMYILILRVDVKALGQNSSMRIGNPVHPLTLSPGKKNKTLVSQQQQQQQQQQRGYGKQMYETPSLSFGALQEIKKGEYVDRPVLQILKVEIFKNYDGTSQYKLDISDGQTMGNFAFIDPQLNWIITSNQLPRYSVAEMTHYIIKPVKYNENRPGPFIPQIMEILEMKIIEITGQEVDCVIGNPVPVLTNYKTLFACDETEKQRTNNCVQLTTGVLEIMMKCVKVNKPILQILSIERMKSSEFDPRYKLLLSDGINVQPFSILEKELNPLVANKALSEFTIIELTAYRVVNYKVSAGKQTLLLFISGLNIKRPGSIVGRKIVKPLVPIENKSVAQNEQQIIRKLQYEAQIIDNELKNLNQLVEEQKQINAALLEKREKSIEERNHLTTALQQQELKNNQLIHDNQQLTAETYVIQENLNDLYKQIQLQCQFLEYSDINQDIIETEIHGNLVVNKERYEIEVECEEEEEEEEDDEYSFENITGFVKDFLAEQSYPNNNSPSTTGTVDDHQQQQQQQQHYYQL